MGPDVKTRLANIKEFLKQENAEGIVNLVDQEYQDFFRIIMGMVAPTYFLEIMDYIVKQIGFAFHNGNLRVLAVENFHLKSINEGVIDHHGLNETYWGLYCATIMSLVAKMLGILDGLSVYDENDPDYDQRLASEIIEAENIEEAIILLESNIYHFLREEFAIFADCENQDEPIITEEFQEHSVNILENNDPNKPPIVIVQYNQDMLPIQEGQWNVMNRAIVKEALIRSGLEKHLETGVVTMVIHGSEVHPGDGIERQAWQLIKMNRLVIGIITENSELWDQQFTTLGETIEAHQQLVEIIINFFPADISRNLLLAASRAHIEDDEKSKEENAQEAFNKLISELIGDNGNYKLFDDGFPLIRTYSASVEETNQFDHLSLSELEELFDNILANWFLQNTTLNQIPTLLINKKKDQKGNEEEFAITHFSTLQNTARIIMETQIRKLVKELNQPNKRREKILKTIVQNSRSVRGDLRKREINKPGRKKIAEMKKEKNMNIKQAIINQSNLSESELSIIEGMNI